MDPKDSADIAPNALVDDIPKALEAAIFGNAEGGTVREILSKHPEALEIVERLSERLRLLLDDGLEIEPPAGLARHTSEYILAYRLLHECRVPESEYETELASELGLVHFDHDVTNYESLHAVSEDASTRVVSLQEWQATTKALLERIPPIYNAHIASLDQISSSFRKQIAEKLGPILNATVHTIPHADLEGKKRVADFVNDAVTRFGLAVQCPNTGLPAKLKATAGNWPGVGRFHFEIYVDGKRKKPSVSDTLPELILVDATPSPTVVTAWEQKVGPKSRRTGRKIT